jgi:hypothetical protein
MQKDKEMVQTAGGLRCAHKSSIWTNISQLNLPNVEKVFLWRACHEILPTRDNLYIPNVQYAKGRQKLLTMLCGTVQLREMSGAEEKFFFKRAGLMVLICYRWWRKCFTNVIELNLPNLCVLLSVYG